jgi:hypothetical protein
MATTGPERATDIRINDRKGQNSTSRRSNPPKQSGDPAHSSAAHHDMPRHAAVGTIGVRLEVFAEIRALACLRGFRCLADPIPAAARR